MKLFHSAASPFVRKVMIVAHEVGLADRLDLVPSKAHPVQRDAGIAAENPLGQVPTLVTDDGTVLFDSRVICEYLNDLGGGSLVPAAGPARWRALTEGALADGMMGAGILRRYEATARPAELRWADWDRGQRTKMTDGLDLLERGAGAFGERFDIGTITVACALGWFDLRFPDLGWRDGRPGLAAWFDTLGARPSLAATVPVG